MSQLLDEIRAAIEASGITRYRISRDLGIDQGQLSKLMAGQCGVSYERLEQLVDYLGLEIIVRPKQDKKRSK